jgi:hypothetical protein
MLPNKFLTTCFKGLESMELWGYIYIYIFIYVFCASKWASNHLSEIGLNEITLQYNLV